MKHIFKQFNYEIAGHLVFHLTLATRNVHLVLPGLNVIYESGHRWADTEEPGWTFGANDGNIHIIFRRWMVTLGKDGLTFCNFFAMGQGG